MYEPVKEDQVKIYYQQGIGNRCENAVNAVNAFMCSCVLAWLNYVRHLTINIGEIRNVEEWGRFSLFDS